ncbi:hypothetical protein ASG43_16125 [Aureimonas sp. Leaf454]|nr:hypothetical protein ASG43_16125 [Aureimonas sp. Leaf454]
MLPFFAHFNSFQDLRFANRTAFVGRALRQVGLNRSDLQYFVYANGQQAEIIDIPRMALIDQGRRP